MKRHVVSTSRKAFWNRRWHAERHAAGICGKCPKPAAVVRFKSGKVRVGYYCKQHAEANRQQIRKYYSKMPVEEARAMWRENVKKWLARQSPSTMRKLWRTRYHTRRNAGLCVHCSTPTSKSMCPTCAEKHRVWILSRKKRFV